jgi:hypothetical protein
MRVWVGALGFLLASAAAQGQRLVFTMVTPASCPVVISSVSSSPDYGFQALTILNDSERPLESIRFKVVLTAVARRDEVADGGHVFVKLEPGDKKNVDVFLGRRSALAQLARELKLDFARAIVTVEAVDFRDGSQWTGDPPVVGVPEQPQPAPR